MKQLLPHFFARDTVQVAQDLLGKIISVNGMKARIVETEAYARDPASHAHTKTERSKIMFETYGHVYVYIIYGIYHCVNFTTERDDAGAVLIRAVEPISGIRKMNKNRETEDIKNLCSGPGKLCQALSIGKQHNSLKLGKEIKVYDDGFNVNITSSPRIGISVATELPWRFFITGNEFVSKARFK